VQELDEPKDKVLGKTNLIQDPTSATNYSVHGVLRVVERQKTVVAGVRHRRFRFMGN
jgi:hypothetical protein